ncbi:MAG: SusC/RagA family TonB-linked outer membrane protein [Agriterribacter sp.]
MHKTLLAFLMSFAALFVLAQQRTITGTVKNTQGEPLAHVSLVVKNTSTGGFTNQDGVFSLNVTGDNAILELSSVGYKTKTVRVGTSNALNIILEMDDTGMEEVIVTAFGMKSRTKPLTYSVPTVSASEITAAGTNNIATALAGKLPGVDFASTASGPMGGNRINIRGVNSLSGNQRPLIVLNGMPIYDNDDNFGGRGFGGNQRGSAINDIDPNDIESISVLSGANAAALYGSQGFNGAIVIQTKSGGKKQKGIGVDYAFNYTKNSILNLTDFQTEFGGGTTPSSFEIYRRTGNGNDSVPYYGFSNGSFGPRFNGQPVMRFDGQIRPWVAQPANLMDFYNDGYTTNHSIGVSGGDDKSSFRLSGTYYKYGGILPNSEMSRRSLLFSGRRKISDIITAEVYVNYIHAFKANPPERLDRGNYSLTTSDIPSVLKEHVVNPSGYYLSDSAYNNLRGSNLVNWILDPLVWSPVQNRWESTKSNFLGNATITITPIKQLSIRLKGGTQRVYELIEAKQPFRSYVAPTNLTQRSGGYSKTQSNDYVNHGDILINYDGNLHSDVSLNAFALYSMDDYYEQSAGLSDANGLLYNNLFSPSNMKPQRIAVGGQTTTGPASNASASNAGSRINALLGSVTLGFKRWLYLNGTLRNDWSSFLPKGRNSFSYPSVGASFIFSDAFQLPKFISFAKLRLSYGEVGIPGSRYFSNTSYSQGSTFNGAILSSFNNNVPPVDIVAERNKSKELGLDIALFNDRFKVDFTYYNNKTTNMINSVAIPPSTGAANPNINAGTMQNKGFDLKLTGVIVRNKNFNWQMLLNGTSIKRKVLSLPADLKQRQLGALFNATFIAEVGASPFDIYMTKWEKDEATGKLIVGKDGFPVPEKSKTILGNSLPKIFGGYINTISYKAFTLNVLLEYRLGGQVVAYDNQFYTAVGLTKSSLFGRDAATGGIAYYVENGKRIAVGSGAPPAGAAVYNDGIVLDGFVVDDAGNKTPNATILPAYNYYRGRYYAFGTEDAVYDNSYIRLRELSLAYTLPVSLSHKIKAQSMSVSFIARNLFFLYNTVPNESPDNTYGTSGVTTGVLYSAHPSTRDLGIALSVTF